MLLTHGLLVRLKSPGVAPLPWLGKTFPVFSTFVFGFGVFASYCYNLFKRCGLFSDTDSMIFSREFPLLPFYNYVSAEGKISKELFPMVSTTGKNVRAKYLLCGFVSETHKVNFYPYYDSSCQPLPRSVATHSKNN